MSRPNVYLTMVFITVILGLSARGLAFTLRFAPVPCADELFDQHTNSVTDIPTPRFFCMVADPYSVTLNVEEPYVSEIDLESEAILETVSRPQPLPTPIPPQCKAHAPQRSLQGVETLLLRDAQTVVEKPAQ